MTELTGAELIAESLEEQDIDYFFNVAGFGIFPLIEAIHQHRDSISYISGSNEMAVGLVAEGYARATREPAFLNVYHSSGTALSMVALSIAWADNTPLILTSTTSSRRLERRDQYAAVPKDLTEATSQYTKWGWHIPSGNRIPEAIERAVTISTTPPMGPVHLSFPMDVYTEPVDPESIDSRHGRTDLYHETEPDSAGVRQATEILSVAENPLILAGGTIGQQYATEQLTQLAETMGAGVMGEGATSTYLPTPSDHPLFIGDLTDNLDLASEADAILALYFEFTEQRITQYPFIDFEGDIIQVASGSENIGKQVVPDVALLGHPRPTLESLVAELEGRQNVQDVRERAMRGHKWSNQNERDMDDLRDLLDADEEPIAREVIDTLPDIFEDLVVVNQATGGEPYVRLIDQQTPEEYYKISQKASTQGWGPAASIGVQIGLPERDVVCIVGDGGFMFSAPVALYTAARHNIPVTIIVLDNQGWGGGGYDRYVTDESDDDIFVGGFEEKPIDMVQIASGLNIYNSRIESIDDVEAELTDAYTQNGPAVLEVPLSKSGTRAFYDYYLE